MPESSALPGAPHPWTVTRGGEAPESERATSLPRLLLRATARSVARLPFAGVLPPVAVAAPIAFDAAHLDRYRRVCGLTGGGNALPALYPHVLALPLQLRLVTDAGFPIRPFGLVHLENRVRLLRPLAHRTPARMTVWAERLAPHEKGVVFSLMQQLADPAGPVWEADSRVLARGLSVAGNPDDAPGEAALALDEVARWTVPADIGRRYARVSGDWNPIHLRPRVPRWLGLRGPIAHGLWTAARALGELGRHMPSAGIEITLRFTRPVGLPSALRLCASGAGSSGLFEVRGDTGDDRPRMLGRWAQLVLR